MQVSLPVPPVGRGDVGKWYCPLATKALLTVLLHGVGAAFLQQVHQDWDQGGVNPSDRLWHSRGEADEAKCEHAHGRERSLVQNQHKWSRA